LPKGTDFSKISEEQIAQIESLINNRPRKCLGFKTPLEVASSCVALRD
jgi:IS30 family transposase